MADLAIMKGGLREVGGSIPEGVTPLVHTVTDPSAHCAAVAIDRALHWPRTLRRSSLFHHNSEMFILFNECKFLGRMVCRCHVAILPFFFGMTLLETMNKV